MKLTGNTQYIVYTGYISKGLSGCKEKFRGKIISKYISIHNSNILNILDVYIEAWFLHLNEELKKKISVKSEKNVGN